MKPTVNEIATDLMVGAVHAAVVWDSTVTLFNQQPQGQRIMAIPLPELAEYESTIGIGILADSTQPTRTLHFARWIASPERGAPVFAKHGFTPLPGDAWAESPELLFYSGSVNRPAIEALLQEFADREGVGITTVFNGCGILCAEMLDLAARSEERNDIRVPDAYYACDICFVEPVKELFPDVAIMTETDIVIAVPKGNPLGLETLIDLARPGLRLGVSNAEQSTLGFMTRRLLKQANVLQAVRSNIRVENPQADFLINHLGVGSLDAAIVYRVNIGEHADRFDAIPIEQAGALAVQPVARSKVTPHPALVERLLDHLRRHRDRFESVGFRWIGTEETVPSAAFPFVDGPGKTREREP